MYCSPLCKQHPSPTGPFEPRADWAATLETACHDNRKRDTALTKIADHDTYIAAAPEAFRPSLNRLRSLLARTLPEAEEIVAYDMPGFRIGKTIVAGYAAFSKQCGVYLLPAAISEHAEELAALGFKPTKTGIKFTPGKPIPDDLIERLARASREAAES